MPAEKWSDEWIDALWEKYVAAPHDKENCTYSICKHIPAFARAVAAQAFEEAATFIETHRPTFHSGVAKIKAEPNGRGAGAYPDETQKCYAAAIRARAKEVADGK